MTDALKIEFKVADLDIVKGLIDVLYKHYYQLPKDVQEYISNNFKDSE